MTEFNPFDMPVENEPATAQIKQSPVQAAPQTPQSAPFAQGASETQKKPSKAGASARRFLRGTPKRILIPSALVITALLVFIFAGGAIMRKVAPAWSLTRASANTGKAMESRLSETPYEAFGQFWSAMVSGQLEGNVSYDDGWSAMDVDFSVLTDLTKGMLQGEFAVNADGQSVDAALFFSRDNAAMTSSLVDKQWYGITYKSFEEDLRTSALPDYFGLSEENIREACDTVADLRELLDQNYQDLLKPYTAVLQDFSKELDYETSTEKTRVGGKNVSCSRILVEISERQIRALAVDLADCLAEDENFRDIMIASYLADGWYTREEAESEYRDWAEDLKRQTKSEMNRYTGDLTLEYYIYQDKLVKSVILGAPAVDGERINLECTMDFGCNPAKDDWNMEYALTSDYGDEMVMAMTYSSEQNGKQFEDALEITLTQYGDTERVFVSNDWDRETGELEMNFDDGYEMLTLFANLIVEKDGFTLDIPDLGEQLGLYEEEASLFLTASTSAKLSTPDFLNLDKWDESTLDAIGHAFQSAMQ